MIAQRYDQLRELRSVNKQGMSKLYTAFDVRKHQSVVLKLLKGDPRNTRKDLKLREMFEREIDIALHLDHPYILHAYDRGTTTLVDLRNSLYVGSNALPPDMDYFSSIQDKNNVPFLVYPYMREGSLSDFINSDPPWLNWPLLKIGELILQAGSALEYMHTRSQPLVHWDVKPANFLVQREETQTRIVHLYLCDFGIARAQKAKTEGTSSVYGTIDFMAPEQFAGKVLCESDQYTLAMMACYLLTGQYPLQSETTSQTEWAYIHQHEVPLSPSMLNSQRIRFRGIDDVVLTALRKTPEERFPNTWIFVKKLFDAIEQQESAPYAVTVEVKQPLTQEAIFAPMPLHPPVNTSEYQIEVDAPAPVEQKPFAKHLIWSALPYTTMQKQRVYTLPTPPYTVCWSPANDTLACFFLDRSPLLCKSNGEIKPLVNVSIGHVACWAPDGDVLAVSSQQYSVGAITIVDTHGMVYTTFPLAAPLCNALDWSANNLLAVWSEGKKSISTYALSSRNFREREHKTQTISTVDMLCEGVGVLRWSPDGSLLAAGGINGALMCWRRDGSYWRNVDFKTTIFNLAWSHTGKLLAVAFKDRKVVVFDVQQDRIKTMWNNLPFVPRTLSFSADNVLTVASTKNYLLLGKVDGPAPTEKHHGQMLAAWSPDGSKLATVDETDDKKIVLWVK